MGHGLPLKPFQLAMTRPSPCDGLFGLRNFRDYLGGFLECVICGWYPAIDRLLQDDFLDVFRREAPLCERRPHVHTELFPFIERKHGADHQDATRAFIVMGTAPYFAPGNACYEILEFLTECSLAGICAVDPGVAKHLAALDHAALVTLLVVHGLFLMAAGSSSAQKVEYRIGILLLAVPCSRYARRQDLRAWRL